MDYIKVRLSADLKQTAQPGFDKTLEEMFQSISPMFSLSERTWRPQMDIYEMPDEIIVLATVAGVEKEDLSVELNTRAIKITGSRSSKMPKENTIFRLAEIQYGSFERVLFLPAPIDTNSVTAAYSNGFLQIKMIKLPDDKPKKIEIRDEN